jgi:hypothetical protein
MTFQGRWAPPHTSPRNQAMPVTMRHSHATGAQVMPASWHMFCIYLWTNMSCVTTKFIWIFLSVFIDSSFHFVSFHFLSPRSERRLEIVGIWISAWPLLRTLDSVVGRPGKTMHRIFSSF